MPPSLSLQDARDRLGDRAVIFLEPADFVDAKVAAGREAELWVFDLATGQIRRGDGKFHALGVVAHPGGWNLGAVIEEPNTASPAEGPHIVGHIVVDVNPRGFVRVRTAKGLNGPVMELKPSSLSKGELEASGGAPDGIVEANPQRIVGTMAVFRNDVDFPDEEGMMPREFVAQSTDGRSIAAVAKLGLLS
ncbi:hypothetical protein HZA85_02880 [Candidatus Uhrbacteria bacterium]|nr:hypothetical protein [Candidatus Uhrbacteria bacterium]